MKHDAHLYTTMHHYIDQIRAYDAYIYESVAIIQTTHRRRLECYWRLRDLLDQVLQYKPQRAKRAQTIMKRYRVKSQRVAEKEVSNYIYSAFWMWAIYDTQLEMNIGYSTHFCDAIEVAGVQNAE